MADQLLNELNRNLKSAEELGDEVWAKRLKKRIADLEKNPPEPAAVVEPVVETEAKPTAAEATKSAAKKSKET